MTQVGVKYRFMKHSERLQIGMSNDFLGAAWRDPEQYGRVVPREEFPMVRHTEVVGVGGARRVARMMQSLKDQGFLPVQIHSHIGIPKGEPVLDTLKVWGMERFLMSPFDIALFFPGMDIVVHAPAVRTFLECSLKKVPQLRTAHILVENHETGLRGLQEAEKQRNALAEHGIHTHVLVDLHHATRHATGRREFDKKWRDLVAYMGSHSGKRDGIIWECHLPEGTQENDSLPDRLSIDKRRDLIDAAGPSIQRMTFEYQRREPLSLLYMNPRDEDREKQRISRKMNLWGKAGLF